MSTSSQGQWWSVAVGRWRTAISMCARQILRASGGVAAERKGVMTAKHEQSLTIDDILGAAAADDDFARLMFERTGNYVGTAVASVINLLNIETIVIGGPTMLAGNVLLNAIIRSARELSFSPSFESTLILAGELGERSAASGAALLSVRE